MEEEKAPSTQSGGRFIDTLVERWMDRTGSVPLQQTGEINQSSIEVAINENFQQEQQVAEDSSTQAGKQRALHSHERVIQNLKRKLRECQEVEASLSASLETEVRNKEEIQTKLDATWAYIENITEYYNYIRESLASFHQHRTNLSTIYDNVIRKQQEAIQKLQLNEAKSKDLENYVTQMKNASLLHDERLREATAEQNKLRKQLENSENELQVQRNELANAHAEEKLMLVKEQQRLLLEYEILQSRLQTAEKEKCDIAKSAAQLENKLLLQEEKMREMLMEQNKLQEQTENAKREFYSQKNVLANAHAEEKQLLIEEQRRLQSKFESLQSRLNMLEQDKTNITEIIAQKDALISKLQDETTIYKSQTDILMTRYNDICTKSESLTEMRNMQQKELLAKTERIQNLEIMLNSIKQREAGLINDVNRIEKKLTNEMDYSKNLENKLSNVQTNLQHSQKQNVEMEKILERTKTTEFANVELQQQLKALQKEKEVIKRESTKIKVSTMSLNSDEDKPLSQILKRTPLTKRQNQTEQEAEVISAERKFFKLRTVQPRTYTKRREN